MSEGLFDDDEPRAQGALQDADRHAPLAERMRPRDPSEFLGQSHLLARGKILASALEGKLTQSLILWGPPGSGKTTLAQLIAARSHLRFVPFSAVLSGIKEIRTVMSSAEDERRRTGVRTLLFVDEIHRFNKAQQDAFLPYVERGDILLIGATTENPSFEINSPLLSRVRVVVLQPLALDDMVRILRHALEDRERGLAANTAASDDVLRTIARAADGDARRALTLLESAAFLSEGRGAIELDTVRDALQRKVLRYDKDGEEHYNLASALHKSIRNSDENAALYWLARVLEAGEDGNYVSRRLVRIACEDVGLADPVALRVALDAAQAFERLGHPEGDLALAQAAVYLARAPKENALEVAFGRARRDVEETAAEPVPMHLRNAATGLMRSLGYGAGYRYAHDDPDAARDMTCLPPGLEGRRYFEGDGAARGDEPK